MSSINVHQGEAPLVVSVPHAGTDLPHEIVDRLVSSELAIKDADWFMDRIYGFARDLGATFIRTSISRTAIDVNRDPSGASLYPGQPTTGLVPTETFDGEPLYKDGWLPDEAEIIRRRNAYFTPYHVALAQELTRLRLLHPSIVLWDCHSIRSVIPRLFEGELPVFNIGTNGGVSADPALTERVRAISAETGLPLVLNGRFRGGWITRNYGEPDKGIHAVQLELAQRFYMDETRPGHFTPDRAAVAERTLHTLLEAALAWVKKPLTAKGAAGCWPPQHRTGRDRHETDHQ